MTLRADQTSAYDAHFLERYFAAEINGLLPVQSRGARVDRMVEAGYIAPMERVFGGRFPVVVRGYALTEKGRMAYCEWASRQEKPRDEEG